MTHKKTKTPQQKHIQLTYTSKVSNVQFKFYAEQCEKYDADYMGTLTDKAKVDYQVKIITDTIAHIAHSRQLHGYIAWGICHYKDPKTDPSDFFDDSREKPHCHVYIWAKNQSHNSGYAKRISTFFKIIGIKYRKEDDNLWLNHGIDKIVSLESCALYTTHDTAQAIKDGKVHYGLNNVYRNITLDEFKKLRNYAEETQIVISKVDWVKYDEMAYELGYDFEDWYSWYDSLPRDAREKKTKIDICREQYDKGIMDKIEVNDHITRCSIFIQGDKGVGKTTAVNYAIRNMRHLDISGGNTGQFDRLTPIYEAVAVSDSKLPEATLLALADDRIANVYHRNQNNSYFAGKYFIVTNNHNIEDWAESCKMQTDIAVPQEMQPGQVFQRYEHVLTPEFEALCDRFFICEIRTDANGRNYLFCISKNDRGSKEEQIIRNNMYRYFRDGFNKCISGFSREDNIIYDNVNK